MSTGAFEPARLAAVISPLRRALLSATRSAADLPDIPDAQIDLIRALPRGTSASPGELAERLRLDRSTVSNLLAAAERGGLVLRTPADGDRRRVVVTASDRALTLFETFDRASAALLREAAAGLTETEAATLAEATPVLERLLAVLTDGAEPNHPPLPAGETESR
jgi:DNA-binding MarR family transcriptional regulator